MREVVDEAACSIIYYPKTQEDLTFLAKMYKVCNAKIGDEVKLRWGIPVRMGINYVNSQYNLEVDKNARSTEYQQTTSNEGGTTTG